MSEQEQENAVTEETANEVKEESSTTNVEEKTVNVNIDASKFTEGLKAEMTSFKEEMKSLISEKDKVIDSLKEEMTKKEEELKKKEEELNKKLEESKKAIEEKEDLTKGKVTKVFEESGNHLTDGKFSIGLNESGRFEFYSPNLASDSSLNRLSRVNK